MAMQFFSHSGYSTIGLILGLSNNIWQKIQNMRSKKKIMLMIKELMTAALFLSQRLISTVIMHYMDSDFKEKIVSQYARF